jgi:hypothetical protein
MRRLLPFAFAALAAAPAVAQPGPTTAALFAQENAIWQAVADHRYDTFAAFLGRDYVGVYADGARDAAQEVAAIHGITLARFQINDFVVRSVDANDIVVTYRVDVSGNAGGRDFAGRYNTSSYWHRTGRQWRVQLHSETQIAP